MSAYVMGTDNGGTLCKAVIFDANGAEIASASTGVRMITPHAGFTERDMDELWAANYKARVTRDEMDFMD